MKRSMWLRCSQLAWSRSRELPLVFYSLLAEQGSWIRVGIQASNISNSALREHCHGTLYENILEQLRKDGEMPACDLRKLGNWAEKFAKEISRFGVKEKESSPVNAGLYSYYLKSSEHDGAACIWRRPRKQVVDGDRNSAIMPPNEDALDEQIVLDPRELRLPSDEGQDIWIDQV